MTALSLSTIVSELSRDGSRQAYLLVSDTGQKAAKMYLPIKNEIVARKITHQVIDFNLGLSDLPDPFSFSKRNACQILLLENTGSVPADKSEQLNNYVKRLTDFALSSLLWYASIETIGRMSSGYGSRAAGAFHTITKIEPE